MAKVEINGHASAPQRLDLGIRIFPDVCKILGDLDPEPKTGHCSVVVPEASFYGKWNYYVEVKCDPNTNREERIEAMAHEILAKIKGGGPDYEAAGVYLDIGTKRFWAE